MTRIRHLSEIPTRLEQYSIADRPLNAEELPMIAYKITDDARVYFDSAENHGGPRKWPSYEAFLGFHIAAAQLQYQPNAEQLQTIVALVYDREHIACIEDRERRKGSWPAA